MADAPIEIGSAKVRGPVKFYSALIASSLRFPAAVPVSL
jgi:hypothetical protein